MKTRKPSAATENASKEVSEWFERLDHPQKEAMMAVREVILGADSRISESIKWSSPTFSFNGDLASIQPRSKKLVSLMFHRGSEIPGRHPSLEGDARLVRTMRFADEDDVRKRRGELEAVVRAWCDRKSG